MDRQMLLLDPRWYDYVSQAVSQPFDSITVCRGKEEQGAVFGSGRLRFAVTFCRFSRRFFVVNSHESRVTTTPKI